jgi:hypothetical protein
MSEASTTNGPTGAAGAGARRALIIANDTYDHASLSQLRAPEADARALAEVLGDPDIGGFEVTVVHNEASYEVQGRIDDLFADSRPDDLLLLHFSGHGLKSDSGELFFAARNTRPDRLGSTSVAADFVQRCMRSARARTIVLFLDCCYGGAFGEGVAVRAAGPVNVVDSFPAGRLGGGRGRAVISASSAMEYAFEGTTLTAAHEPQPSVFTSAVVEGLRSGEADRDEDGLVALGELYDYVFDRVREQNPRQTPGRDVEMSGEVYLARSRRKRVRPVPISDALRTALGNPDPTYRRGAVLELRDRLAHEDLGVALGALEALREIARSDTRSVAADAVAVIDAAAPRVTPTTLDFGELPPDADVALERELHVHGLPIAREVHAEADPPLSAIAEGGTVTVTFSPTGRAYAGTVTVIGPTGSVIVPVEARVASRWASPAGEAAEPVGAEPVPEPTVEPAQVEPASEPPAAVLAERRVAPVRPDRPVSESPTQAADRHPRPAGKPHPTSKAEMAGKDEKAENAKTTAEPTPGQRAMAYASPEPEPEPVARPSVRRLGRWPAWTLFAGGFLVIVGMPWWFVDQTIDDANWIVLGPGSRALLAVSAGILVLAPRVRAEVAIGYLSGCAAGAALGTLSSVGFGIIGGLNNMQPGWLAAVLGQSLIVLTGLVVISTTAWQSPLPRGPIQWRDPSTYGVLVAGGVTVLLLLSFGGFVAEVRESGFWAGMAVVWAGLTVALIFVALAARPSTAGRLMIFGWVVALLGYALSDWVYWTVHNDSQTWAGMAWLVLSSIALAISGGFIGPRSTSEPAQA